MEKKLFLKDQTFNVNASNALKGLQSEVGNGSVYRFCVFRHPYNNTRYVYIYRYIFRIINLVGPFTQTKTSIIFIDLELAVSVKSQRILQIPPFPGPEKIKINFYMKMQIVICISAINIYIMDLSGYVTNIKNTSNWNMWNGP